MAFDSFGNIWVADYGNNRVQKFLLENGIFGKKNFILLFASTGSTYLNEQVRSEGYFQIITESPRLALFR